MSQRTFNGDSAVKAGATFDAAKLKGKSVVVTGGASGLGEAFVRAFVAAGSFVAFGDVADERGRQLEAELGADKSVFVHCDVLNWQDQVALFKTAIAKSPAKTLDIVCANAGIGGHDDMFPSETASDDEPVEPTLGCLKINLLGMAYTASLAMHYLPRQPQGDDRDRVFVMTASMSGYLDHPRAPQYNSSKWGTRGLFRSLRNTMPEQGIRVGIIAPWFVRTRIIPDVLVQMLDAGNIEWAHAEDAASAVLHMASDKSINGRSLAIVPRSYDPRGYKDLELDNSEGRGMLDSWAHNLGLVKPQT